MLIRRPRRSDVKPSEITSESIYRRRREFMKAAGTIAAGSLLAPQWLFSRTLDDLEQLRDLGELKPSPYSTDESPNSFSDITTYNNFYEYGFGKDDPARHAPGLLRVEPWSVEVTGECEKPGTYAFEDLVKPHRLEERIYRFRCVEAWSMVIPWVGIPMVNVLKRFQPTSRARYVEFVTLMDPEQMPAQRRPSLPWPYREGLRIDEAMHPLSIFAVGVYGKEMPAQNGAPIRLVVPWKYGFKSSKSLVKIRFTEEQPLNTWQQITPEEYGFYANVNPEVDHPRWSQARERRVGSFFRQSTQMFNGYREEVAHLYRGMDLRSREYW
ncbi:MAG: protein-methionine-sulfoxide reductase catalytic subunit MsrP [Ectothiorhodospiraceae bacterium]|nr:protein-methionine-sulfoxide reductase catalytic subunit MsrP [Ectothiorhodospiraceae bacterium]